MSIKNHSISIHFARAITNAAKRKSLDYPALLQQAGINEKMLENPNIRITPEQLSRLVRAIWETADDEFMCMASHPCKHGVFTLMAKQAVRCRDLRAALFHLCSFYNLITDALTLEFVIIGDDAHLSMELTDPDIDSDYMLREFLFLLWHRFPSWLIGQRIPLSYIDLNYPEPAHMAEHKLLYPFQINYNQPVTKMVFKTEYLTAPIVQTPATLRAYLRRAPLDWFKRQTYYPVFTRRVIDYLEVAGELSSISMDAVATKLHITSRTLRRKLVEEGTSFKSLKNAIRRDAAIHYLSQPSIPLSQIARKIGFSESAAFSRAFKHWTGVSPSTYRKS